MILFQRNIYGNSAPPQKKKKKKKIIHIELLAPGLEWNSVNKNLASALHKLCIHVSQWGDFKSKLPVLEF